MSKRKGESKSELELKRACASSALDFSQLPFVQSAVESSQYVEYNCFTALPKDDESSLEFRIDKTDCYTDLSRSYLYMQVQILTEDGNTLGATDSCTFVNNIGYALFDSVDVYISDQRITKPESHYPWWTYLYNLMYYPKQAKETHLRAGNLWYLDEAGRFDRVDLLEDNKNQAMKDRQSICGDSKKVWLCIKVLFNTQLNRLLPNQTDISVTFNRSPTSLCLLAPNGNYKIKILDAKLHVNRVKMFESALQGLENILQDTGFLYPGTNPIVRTKTISQGDQNVDWSPITGKLPQRIYLFMVRQGAYNGKISKNPYNFSAFGISRLQVFNNGKCLPYSQGLTRLSGSSPYLKYYMTTLQAINNPDAFQVELYEYSLGYFVIAIDISSDFSAGSEYNNIDEFGSLRISLDFVAPLFEAITLFCVGEVQEVLKIDGDRNPTFL